VSPRSGNLSAAIPSGTIVGSFRCPAAQDHCCFRAGFNLHDFRVDFRLSSTRQSLGFPDSGYVAASYAPKDGLRVPHNAWAVSPLSNAFSFGLHAIHFLIDPGLLVAARERPRARAWGSGPAGEDCASPCECGHRGKGWIFRFCSSRLAASCDMQWTVSSSLDHRIEQLESRTLPASGSHPLAPVAGLPVDGTSRVAHSL
jgi:hypothetical protein